MQKNIDEKESYTQKMQKKVNRIITIKLEKDDDIQNTVSNELASFLGIEAGVKQFYHTSNPIVNVVNNNVSVSFVWTPPYESTTSERLVFVCENSDIANIVCELSNTIIGSLNNSSELENTSKRR